MSPFAVDYWLERCEGFRVDTPEGRVGFVEAVLVSAETGCAATLLVRGGTPSGLITVDMEEIDDVVLNEERIILRSPTRAGALATPMKNGGAMTKSVDHPHVSPGDVVHVHGHRVGEIARRGEILEVLGETGHEHYRVCWDDGRESLFYPSNDTVIQPGAPRRKETP